MTRPAGPSNSGVVITMEENRVMQMVEDYIQATIDRERRLAWLAEDSRLSSAHSERAGVLLDIIAFVKDSDETKAKSLKTRLSEVEWLRQPLS
jgi:hypothetical protein